LNITAAKMMLTTLPRFSVFLVWITALYWFDLVQAQTNVVCMVCDQTITSGTVWRHRDGLVCPNCYALETRCSICDLPLKPPFTKTGDGRALCRADASNAVLTEEAARDLFETTRLELQQLFSGALDLKNQRVGVSLFEVDYWNYRDGKLLPQPVRRTGFAQSRQLGESMVHNVLLWSGQLKIDLMAVCAHEYTHLWINETKAEARAMQPDTEEAICELVAYKLMQHKNVLAQQEKIRANRYTQGKINQLIDYDAQYGFKAILDFVRTGTEPCLEIPVIPRSILASLATASQTATSVASADPAPTTLKLQGVFLGKKQHRALINGCSLGVSEQKNVRVGADTVMVRCVGIQANAVVVQVNNATNLVTLTLDRP
jgi:hypothetical protein